MSAPSLSASELARALGKTERTVRRWPDLGCPRAQERPLRFHEAEVRAWCAGRGLRVAPPRAEAPAAPSSPATSRATLAKAELLRRVTHAKRNELELAAELGLKDLGLDEKIRAAQSHDDLLAYTKEVMALVGSGELSPPRGQALRSLVAVAERVLNAKREAEGDGEPERLHLATPEGVALLEDFEWIVSDDRRAAIRAFARGEREADEDEFDTFDLAANLAPDAEGNDPMPEEPEEEVA